MSTVLRTDTETRPRVRAARLFVDELVRLGVTHVFGHPGGAALPLYDALYDTPAITHLLVRHEQSGAHAAEGFARATGRPGVCIATSGPGATNLITGLADAMMDSTPIVALTAQVPTHLIGRDGFQEADVVGLTQPVTKHNWLVRDAESLVPTIRKAFRTATSGRQGPVLVDIPRDFLQVEIEEAGEAAEAAPRGRHAEASALRHAALAISNARRPVLYVGGGVISSGASEELRRLARKARIPVTTTLMGKGALPGDGPPVARDARDARHGLRELGDPRERPDHRRRRPVRRPRHAEDRGVGAARADRPHRRGRGGDRKEPEGATIPSPATRGPSSTS